MKKSYYTLKGNDAMARSYNCPISLKFSVELAREIKDKPYTKVINYLNDIIALKRHLPLKRYNSDVAHRKGTAVSGVKSGRYPVKVAKYFKKILEIAKANADYKGLDSEKKDLIIKGCVVSQGVKRYNFQTKGKRRLRRDQTTNVELVLVQQGKFIKKEKVEKKVEKTEVKPKLEKTEVKAEEKVEKKVEKNTSEKKSVKKESKK